ncbi:MAG: YcaO-like family protein [Humidesulfovibrio sp.]|uniref:YcaO-like family protein n=1 Tax=Humidesulfovibrio sp. TaxID=2910988 RepID=UPI0027FFE957|nr:YcaO-like family protein [Humidesulfovibrio sp.]MDQ7836825.1 YcaO-like family protein [Humidesulfovibrio sp.]
MRYELRLMDTLSGVGCFAAHPGPNLSFSEMLEHLRQNPLDDFMHQHLLFKLGEHRTKKFEKLIEEVQKDGRCTDPVLAALLVEACLGHERFAHLLPRLSGLDLREISRHTPAVHIRSYLLADQPLHNEWTMRMQMNIVAHEPLAAPGEIGLDTPYAKDGLPPAAKVTVAEMRQRLAPVLPKPLARRPATETSAHALEKLKEKNVFVGQEMAHKASLSPIALLRMWLVELSVRSGEMNYSLSGMQTSYGRGLEIEGARASYLMEVAERVSSYASIGRRGVMGLARACPLTYGSHEEVSANAHALDLSRVRLEVPYEGQRIYWMPGEERYEGGLRPILAPVQFVYLFCNLEEQSLFSALGSTGLASGNTMAEAKVHALGEALERDAEAVTPFDLSRCFRLTARDERVARLLSDYQEANLNVWFMDCTSEFGVPCYKAIVVGRHGDVNKGMGAHLSGPRAAVSAMTEIPYPFPGPATLPVPEGLPVRVLEDLPDHSTGSAEGDLMVLEQVLVENGYPPSYMDLTRADLGIPAVRALVPGLEWVADFDRFSRLSPRLYANYLRQFGAI